MSPVPAVALAALVATTIRHADCRTPCAAGSAASAVQVKRGRGVSTPSGRRRHSTRGVTGRSVPAGAPSATLGISDDASVPAIRPRRVRHGVDIRSEEHTSELQSLMRISYAHCCWKKKNSTSPEDYSKHIKIEYTQD